MPRGAVQLIVAVSTFLSIFSWSPLSVVASHLKSDGTLTLNSIGVVLLNVSHDASLIVSVSGNFSPTFAVFGASDDDVNSLIVAIIELTFASRASSASGLPFVVTSVTLPSRSTTNDIGPTPAANAFI